MVKTLIPHKKRPDRDQLPERTAFTLVELIVSLAVSAALVGGLSAALAIGLRSAQPSQRVSGDIQTAKLADKLLSEFVLAKSVNTASANEIEFTTSSLSGSPTDDTIRYQWTNDGSLELKRAFNNGPLEALDPKVTSFQLDYHLRSFELPVAATVETPEMLLIEHDSTPGGTQNTYANSAVKFCAQWFKVNLHPNAIAWKLTRVQICMKKPSTGLGNYYIAICNANPSTYGPTGTALTSLTQQVNDLPTNFDWISFDLTDLPGLVPETGYVLRVASTLSSVYPQTQFETASQPTLPRGHWLTTSNLGFSWSSVNNVDNMRFRVYGTITLQAW